MQREKVTLNGVNIYPFSSFEELLDYVDGNKGILVAINALKIVNATPQTRDIVNRNIGYCDGAGAVMAVKQKGYDAVKLPGCELWLKIIETTYRQGRSFYLVGGQREVIEATVSQLKKDFPGINITNYRDGYMKDDAEREALINDIAQRKPDVVFVAMGSPRQELLMEAMASRHAAIYQGLGGSFDVYTGRVKRAPKWWLDHNLEFLYRLLNEPSRIVRQVRLVKFWVMVKLGFL